MKEEEDGGGEGNKIHMNFGGSHNENDGMENE